VTGLTSHWKKSSRSNGSEGCVEARLAEGRVEFRDSKNPAGPVLLFAPTTYLRFVEALRNGNFDPR
jgi:uncharacterized protein DUF397